MLGIAGTVGEVIRKPDRIRTKAQLNGILNSPVAVAVPRHRSIQNGCRVDRPDMIQRNRSVVPIETVRVQTASRLIGPVTPIFEKVLLVPFAKHPVILRDDPVNAIGVVLEIPVEWRRGGEV